MSDAKKTDKQLLDDIEWFWNDTPDEAEAECLSIARRLLAERDEYKAGMEANGAFAFEHCADLETLRSRIRKLADIGDENRSIDPDELRALLGDDNG